jgi:hypothetical protein
MAYWQGKLVESIKTRNVGAFKEYRWFCQYTLEALIKAEQDVLLYEQEQADLTKTAD